MRGVGLALVARAVDSKMEEGEKMRGREEGIWILRLWTTTMLSDVASEFVGRPKVGRAVLLRDSQFPLGK